MLETAGHMNRPAFGPSS